MKHYDKKVDLAQPGIVAALEAAGCRVLNLSWAGRGLPDLHVVNPRGLLFWLEVKNPLPPAKVFKDGRQRKDDRTDAELKMATVIPVQVVRTPAEALAAVGLVTEAEPAIP